MRAPFLMVAAYRCTAIAGYVALAISLFIYFTFLPWFIATMLDGVVRGGIALAILTSAIAFQAFMAFRSARSEQISHRTCYHLTIIITAGLLLAVATL